MVVLLPLMVSVPLYTAVPALMALPVSSVGCAIARTPVIGVLALMAAALAIALNARLSEPATQCVNSSSEALGMPMGTPLIDMSVAVIAGRSAVVAPKVPMPVAFD